MHTINVLFLSPFVHVYPSTADPKQPSIASALSKVPAAGGKEKPMKSKSSKVVLIDSSDNSDDDVTSYKGVNHTNYVS